MTMTALPTPPSTSDPTNFAVKADALLAALPNFVTEANALASGLNFPGLMANSTTSVAIGTGSKSFTIETGKTFVAGQSIFVQYTTTPTNWMYGTVTSYNSGTGALVVNVTSVLGSGTYALWTVSLGEPLVSSRGFSMSGAINEALATVASATTPDIFGAAANIIDYTGTATCTGFAAATQAGARRTLVCAGSAVFTAGANMLIDGFASGQNVRCAAGDKAHVTAVSTTQFKLSVERYNGQPVGTAQTRLPTLTATVGANALTIGLAAMSLDFRSATLGSGAVTTLQAAPPNLVISSGSTLGTVNAQQSRLAVLAINSVGVELAVVNISGGNDLSETGLISTTAEGGAGAAGSANVIYSTTARSNVAYRVVGYVESTQATAGTWATAPSTIQGAGGQAITAMSSLGYGQTWQSVTRTSGTTYYNTTGKPIAISMYITSATTSPNVTISINGATAIFFVGVSYGTSAVSTIGFFIIPAGASYVLTEANISTRTVNELR